VYVFACAGAVREHLCVYVCVCEEGGRQLLLLAHHLPRPSAPITHHPPQTQTHHHNDSLGVVLYVLLTHRPLYADPADAAFACLMEDRCAELLAHYAALGITGACV
jgi:hypothetical protein